MVATLFKRDERLSRFPLWLAVGCILLLTIIYLSLSSTTIVPMQGHMDKLYHGFAYCCLMFWWLQLFPNRLARVVLAVLFVLMGGGIEFIQSFHPLRYMDWLDFLANTAGVILAALLGLTKLDQALCEFERRVF